MGESTAARRQEAPNLCTHVDAPTLATRATLASEFASRLASKKTSEQRRYSFVKGVFPMRVEDVQHTREPAAELAHDDSERRTQETIARDDCESGARLRYDGVNRRKPRI